MDLDLEPRATVTPDELVPVEEQCVACGTSLLQSDDRNRSGVAFSLGGVCRQCQEALEVIAITQEEDDKDEEPENHDVETNECTFDSCNRRRNSVEDSYNAMASEGYTTWKNCVVCGVVLLTNPADTDCNPCCATCLSAMSQECGTDVEATTGTTPQGQRKRSQSRRQTSNHRLGVQPTRLDFDVNGNHRNADNRNGDDCHGEDDQDQDDNYSDMHDEDTHNSGSGASPSDSRSDDDDTAFGDDDDAEEEHDEEECDGDDCVDEDVAIVATVSPERALRKRFRDAHEAGEVIDLLSPGGTENIARNIDDDGHGTEPHPDDSSSSEVVVCGVKSVLDTVMERFQEAERLGQILLVTCESPTTTDPAEEI